jgi:predicted AlkP superfamily pyrophosphatase or phosphodiesterase
LRVADYREQERERIKAIAKHVLASLKVGEENAITREEILIYLEHHGITATTVDISDAISYLYESNLKHTFPDYMFYLRKSNEPRNFGWY